MPNSNLVRLREISERLDGDEDTLSRFFEFSPCLMGVMINSGYLYKANRQWQNFLGWTKDELYERPLSHLIHQDDIDEFYKFIHDLEQFDISSLKCRLQHKNGEYVGFEFSATKWLGGESNLIGKLLDNSVLIE